MKDIFVMDTLEQFRCISDPLRIKIIHALGKEPMTSQMLGEKLDIPRSKIHYHLKELEKNGLVIVSKTEQIRNFIQKFYEPVAKAMIPSMDLLMTQTDILRHNLKSLKVVVDEQKYDTFLDELDELVEKYQTDYSEAEDNTKSLFINLYRPG